MKKILFTLGISILFLSAFGCGQKGPLYLPKAPTKSDPILIGSS
jgi:predicted small lipoprotein YifL